MSDLSLIKKNFIDYVDKIIINNKVSHAYLIEIDNYESDITYIYDFIKMILCNITHDELSISTDKIIYLIDHNDFPDIKIIEPDGSWIKKGQLLDLQKDFSNKSLYNNKRIYIIKEAEKLNSSSANTILKFLEEPEPDIVAILLTDNRYHVIDTILSRCQILTLKEDSFNFNIDNSIIDLLNAVVNPNNFFIKYNYFINEVVVDKNICKNKLSVIENIIVKFLNSSFRINDESFNNNDIYDCLCSVDKSKLLYYISVIEDEIQKLDFNVNYKLWLDSLFSKLIGG
jgi:hypothetical protein